MSDLLFKNEITGIYKRNVFTNKIEEFEYPTKNGFIFWRKLVPKEFLYPNPNKTDKLNVEDCSDDELIIRLGGTRYLAQLRGFISITYRPLFVNETSVSLICSIKWVCNDEFPYRRNIVTEGIGSANMNNVEGFCRDYLPEIAQNRAFSRAVRNFLNIDSVAEEELGSSIASATEEFVSSIDPTTIIERKMKEKNISFDQLKATLISENIEGAESFEDLKSIPDFIKFTILNILSSKDPEIANKTEEVKKKVRKQRKKNAKEQS